MHGPPVVWCSLLKQLHDVAEYDVCTLGLHELRLRVCRCRDRQSSGCGAMLVDYAQRLRCGRRHEAFASIVLWRIWIVRSTGIAREHRLPCRRTA